jgi:hypothetical protein
MLYEFHTSSINKIYITTISVGLPLFYFLGGLLYFIVGQVTSVAG